MKLKGCTKLVEENFQGFLLLLLPTAELSSWWTLTLGRLCSWSTAIDYFFFTQRLANDFCKYCFTVCARKSNFSLKAKCISEVLAKSFPPSAVFSSSLPHSWCGGVILRASTATLIHQCPSVAWAVVLAWGHLETPCHGNCNSWASLRCRKWNLGVSGSRQDGFLAGQAVGRNGRINFFFFFESVGFKT